MSCIFIVREHCFYELFLLVVTEIARQAAQIKLLRKLQKQEQARAAKEAKTQQGMHQTCERLL